MLALCFSNLRAPLNDPYPCHFFFFQIHLIQKVIHLDSAMWNIPLYLNPRYSLCLTLFSLLSKYLFVCGVLKQNNTYILKYLISI